MRIRPNMVLEILIFGFEGLGILDGKKREEGRRKKEEEKKKKIQVWNISFVWKYLSMFGLGN